MAMMKRAHTAYVPMGPEMCGSGWMIRLIEEEKKAVTCMGHEVPGMNELEYVEEMLQMLSRFRHVNSFRLSKML